MRGKRKTIAAIGAVAALAGGGAAVAVATGGGGGDDDERPIEGAALQQAEQAALAHTGGGTVTETEVGDEESRYEVEVRLPDGSTTDVQLNGSFRVVGDEAEGSGEDEGPEDKGSEDEGSSDDGR